MNEVEEVDKVAIGIGRGEERVDKNVSINTREANMCTGGARLVQAPRWYLHVVLTHVKGRVNQVLLTVQVQGVCCDVWYARNFTPSRYM